MAPDFVPSIDHVLKWISISMIRFRIYHVTMHKWLWWVWSYILILSEVAVCLFAWQLILSVILLLCHGDSCFAHLYNENEYKGSDVTDRKKWGNKYLPLTMVMLWLQKFCQRKPPHWRRKWKWSKEMRWKSRAKGMTWWSVTFKNYGELCHSCGQASMLFAIFMSTKEVNLLRWMLFLDFCYPLYSHHYNNISLTVHCKILGWMFSFLQQVRL